MCENAINTFPATYEEPMPESGSKAHWRSKGVDWHFEK
jgi:hypothetical protein